MIMVWRSRGVIGGVDSARDLEEVQHVMNLVFLEVFY